jgi:hypothetical protein
MRYLLTLCIGLAIAPVLTGARRDIGPFPSPAHAEEETTADMLADHVRRQGYPCERALSAVRDAQRSKPDEAVWVLKCTNLTYRLTLIPDMAWKVEQLE